MATLCTTYNDETHNPSIEHRQIHPQFRSPPVEIYEIMAVIRKLISFIQSMWWLIGYQ